MEEIYTQFAFSRARNAEHYQTHEELIVLIPEAFAASFGIGHLRTNYVNMFNREDVCFHNNPAYSHTKEVNARNRKRIDQFLYVGRRIDISKYSHIETEKQAGERLAYVMKPYLGAPQLSLARCTGEISDFVKRMKEEEYAEDIATLGLATYLEQLEKENNAFIEVYRARSVTEFERVTSETMATVRPKVDEAFRELVLTINALYRVNAHVTKDPEKEEQLLAVIKSVNSTLYRLKKSLSRIGLLGNGAKDTEEEEEKTEQVKPEITDVYSKVEDPFDPTGVTRGKETIMKWVGDFELVNEKGDGPGKIILTNPDNGLDEEIKPESILKRNNKGCEFLMVPDLAEGTYKIRVETYHENVPLIVEYAKTIKLV